MTRNRARTVVCVASALLVGLALAGCNRHNATPGSTVTPAGASSTVGGGASGKTSPPSLVSPSAPQGGPTLDPVASGLDQIDQLINDINNSINSSDSSPNDGE